MAGDLEDFLKRAAERRAQKQQQGGGAARPTPPKPKPRPEYTEVKRERQIRPVIEEAIPIAEIVHLSDETAEQNRRMAVAQQKSDDARARMAKQQQEIHAPTEVDRGTISIAGGTPAEQLLDLIRRPGGIQQAYLLKEILERPINRWD